MPPIRLHVNGVARAIDAPGTALLLDILRDDLGLAGTRFGCGEDLCGACHVLVDGRALASCTTPLSAVEGRAVTTVEGLDARLRQAFVDEQAAQCGYCSSGMLIGAAALLLRNPRPTDAQVREALDGHLCRCGVHNRIVRAVLRAAREQP